MVHRALVFTILTLLGCATDSASRAPGGGPLHSSCAAGDLQACHEQAQALEAGTVEDQRAALVAYQYGCLLEHAPSCSGLARMYGQTDRGTSNARVRRALESACSGGEMEACVELGDSASRRRAMELYERACDGGHGLGCHKLARHLRRGWMLEQNIAQAVGLDEKACELGSVKGCVAAGQAYLFGSGVTQDSERAFQLLDPTCTEEVTEGCVILAKMYEEGIGVTADRARATRYYDMSATQATDRVADSPASAYIVFVDACNRQNFIGCFNAGWFRAEGVEIERNITTSRELFQRACDAGVENACEQWKTIRPGGGTIVASSSSAPDEEESSNSQRTEENPK